MDPLSLPEWSQVLLLPFLDPFVVDDLPVQLALEITVLVLAIDGPLP